MNPPPPVTSGAGSSRQTSGLAIASMILGIAGIVLCLGPLAGIPAVIMGHMATSRIRKSGGVLAGSGMATAGLVMGYLSILMTAIAIPNLVKARNAAQHAVCKVNLNSIQQAKELWAKENAKPDDAVPGDEDLFGAGKNLSKKPECRARGSYSLSAVKEYPSCTVHGSTARRE